MADAFACVQEIRGAAVVCWSLPQLLLCTVQPFPRRTPAGGLRGPARGPQWPAEVTALQRSGRWAAAIALLLAACSSPGGAPNTIAPQEVRSQLPIPPVAETIRDDGRTVVALRAAPGRTDFGQEGGPADTIGLNGSYLGPTIRLRNGDDIRAEVTNALDEMTTLHWHGLHVPAKSDGGPHSMIEPGDTWRPTWTVNQAAGTLWYHSHPHGQTAQQVYRGLAGMLLIDDPEAPDVGFPISTESMTSQSSSRTRVSLLMASWSSTRNLPADRPPGSSRTRL